MKEVIEQAVIELKKIISNYVKPGVSPFVLRDNLNIDNPKDRGLIEALVNITNEMSESLNIHDNNTQRYKINFDKLNSMVEVRSKERNISAWFGPGEYSELQNKSMSLLTFVTKLKNESVRIAEEEERRRQAAAAEEERKRKTEEEGRRQLALEEAKLRAQEETNRIEKEKLALERVRIQSDQEKNGLLSIIKNQQEEIKRQGEELTQMRTIMTQMQSQMGSQRGDVPDAWAHLAHHQPNGNSLQKPAPAIDAEIEFLTKRIGTHHTNLIRQLGILSKIPAFEVAVNRMIEDILINYEKPKIQGIHATLSTITYNDSVREPLIKEALGKIFTLEKAELATPKIHEDAIAAILTKEKSDLTQNQNAENTKAKAENRAPRNFDHLTPESQVVHKLARFVNGEEFNKRKPIIFSEIPELHQRLLAKKQELIDLRKAKLAKPAIAPGAK